jgi:hypothetical protein
MDSFEMMDFLFSLLPFLFLLHPFSFNSLSPTELFIHLIFFLSFPFTVNVITIGSLILNRTVIIKTVKKILVIIMMIVIMMIITIITTVH